MNKKTLIIIVITLIALSAVVVVLISIFSKKPLIDLPGIQPQVNLEKPFTPAPFETEKKKEKYYSFDLSYPRSSATSLPEIALYVEKSKEDILKLIPTTESAAEYEGLDEDRAYVLKMDTTVYTSSTTITYKIESYTFTGGAHGGTSVATFTYDRDGKLITLDDILIGSDSLNKLSVLARTYFYSKLGSATSREVIDIGTEAKRENFSTWYITDIGITFIFQQYQIGPYTIGIQEFPLSRTEAKTLFIY